jgi:hypothetical protein
MPNSTAMAPYWRKYRESLWAHLRVPTHHGSPADSEIRRLLFLRRPGYLHRRLLNHDEIAVMLQAHGFRVRSLTPDWHSLSTVASAAAQASVLIGINSGAYNAVFLPTGGGALELGPHCSEFFSPQKKGTPHAAGSYARASSFSAVVGFQRLGVHYYVYACPHLYTSDWREILSNSMDAPQDARSAGAAPIVVSPRTILTLLSELVEKAGQARASGAEEGSITRRWCLAWEANHTQSWAP